MNSFASKHIYISKSVKNVWDEKGLNNQNGYIIYDGVRTELYHQNFEKRSKKLHMIFLGGYAESKGQENLIDALKDLRQEDKDKIVIDFFGNGSEEYVKKLKNKIEKNGLLSIMNIHPYQQNIWKIVPDYDVGLTCSHLEGFGRVTVEYMMAGLCPIASNGGATPEIVQHGETGILYDSLDEGSLRDAIIWAINNPEAVHRIGENAAKSARRCFSMEKHAKEIKKLYYEVLKDAHTDVLDCSSCI